MSHVPLLIFLVPFLAGISLYILTYHEYSPFIEPELGRNLSRAEYGAIGDYFGGILNPGFAFFSFMALLGTIYLQLRQLEAQQNELELTRKELKQSREAQQASAKELRLQNQLQFHAVRAAGLSTLISTTSIEAQNAKADQAKTEALDEMGVYANQLNAELEAVATLSPEGVDRIRSAEEDLFGFSTSA